MIYDHDKSSKKFTIRSIDENYDQVISMIMNDLIDIDVTKRKNSRLTMIMNSAFLNFEM